METLFIQELLALNCGLDLGYQIYYWRIPDGREVDFVLYGPMGLLVLEVKKNVDNDFRYA